MPKSSEVQSRLKSIEALVHQIEKATDPALTATAKELVQLLMELHGAGIERMLEIVNQTATSGASISKPSGATNSFGAALPLRASPRQSRNTRHAGAGKDASLSEISRWKRKPRWRGRFGSGDVASGGQLPWVPFVIRHSQISGRGSDLRGRTGRYGDYRSGFDSGAPHDLGLCLSPNSDSNGRESKNGTRSSRMGGSVWS